MSDRRPPSPGDDRRGGPLPPVGARTPGLDDLSGPDGPDEPGGSPPGWDHDEGDQPNYLVRRALMVGAIVVAIAIVAVVASRFIGGDDDDSSSGGPDTDWNALVVLTANEIVVVDPESGDVVDTFDADDDLLDAQSLVAGDVLVTMTDEGRIVLTDLTDGTTTRGRAGDDQTLIRSRDNPTIGIVGLDNGGDITIVDTVDRTTLSVGDVAGIDDPLIFAPNVRVNPSGTHAAMADARTFQSVVVDLDDESAQLLAGQIVAIGDESVVTAQRAGDNTELEFYDLAGERLGSVDVPTPAAAMLTPEGSVLLVDADGSLRTANADGDVSDIGAIVDPDAATVDVDGGFPVLNGTRMLVRANDRVFVIDTTGRQVGSAQGQIAGSPTLSSKCIIVGSTRSDGSSVQLDTETGMVLAEISGGIDAGGSADGCTTWLIGAQGNTLIIDGELVEVDATSVVAVAPDGTAYAVRDGRDTELIEVGQEGSVEITDEISIVYFASR